MAHVDVQNGPLLGQQESRAVTRKPRDAAAVLFDFMLLSFHLPFCSYSCGLLLCL